MGLRALNERLIKLENKLPTVADHLFELWFAYGTEYLQAIRFKGDVAAEVQRMQDDLTPEEVDFVLAFSHQVMEDPEVFKRNYD